MSGYICKCGHDKNVHGAPATGGMYDGTNYGKCSVAECECEAFIKFELKNPSGYKFAPTYEEFQTLEKRVQVLENQNCANQIKDILGELYSWADSKEKYWEAARYWGDKPSDETLSFVATRIREFKEKIAGIQKRYGIGT